MRPIYFVSFSSRPCPFFGITNPSFGQITHKNLFGFNVKIGSTISVNCSVAEIRDKKCQLLVFEKGKFRYPTPIEEQGNLNLLD